MCLLEVCFKIAMKCYECIKMASWKKTASGWKIQFGQFFCLNPFGQKTFEIIQELGNNVQNGWKPLKHWRTVSASKGTDWWLESVCIFTTVREWCPRISVPKIHLPQPASTKTLLILVFRTLMHHPVAQWPFFLAAESWLHQNGFIETGEAVMFRL